MMGAHKTDKTTLRRWIVALLKWAVISQLICEWWNHAWIQRHQTPAAACEPIVDPRFISKQKPCRKCDCLPESCCVFMILKLDEDKDLFFQKTDEEFTKTYFCYYRRNISSSNPGKQTRFWQMSVFTWHYYTTDRPETSPLLYVQCV